jgi:hypothetical protein
MGITTPLIRAQSSLPALGRARPGQPAVPTEGPYRAAFAAGAPIAKPAAKAEAEAQREEKLQAELQSLRHPLSGKPGEQRSWSYLATEGGKPGAGKGRK